MFLDHGSSSHIFDMIQDWIIYIYVCVCICLFCVGLFRNISVAMMRHVSYSIFLGDVPHPKHWLYWTSLWKTPTTPPMPPMIAGPIFRPHKTPKTESLANSRSIRLRGRTSIHLHSHLREWAVRISSNSYICSVILTTTGCNVEGEDP